MPKIYTITEKTEIINKLKAEANRLLQEKGVKKTTVDELVNRVGIPKGTFYLFYKSKELLLFDVIQDYHKLIEDYLIAEIGKLASSFNSVNLAKILVNAIKMTLNSCLKVLMVPQEMDLLISRLPDEIVSEHLDHDDDMMEKLFKNLLNDKQVNIKVYSGAFRAIVFACLYPREIGEENFYDSIELLIKGLLLQIMD